MTSPPPTSDEDSERSESTEEFLPEYLPFLLFRSYQVVSAEFHAGLPRMELDVTECRILTMLGDLGSGSLQLIQHSTGVIQPTASRACERLLRKGYLSREVDPDDRRSRIFALTPSGEAIREVIVQDSIRAVENALSRTSVDASELATMLRQLLRDIQGHDRASAPGSQTRLHEQPRGIQTDGH